MFLSGRLLQIYRLTGRKYLPTNASDSIVKNKITSVSVLKTPAGIYMKYGRKRIKFKYFKSFIMDGMRLVNCSLNVD